MEEAWQIILSLGLLKSSKPFKRYGVHCFHVWYIPHTFEKRHVERLTAGWRIIDTRLHLAFNGGSMVDYFEPGFAQIVQAVQEIWSTPFSRLIHTHTFENREML